jgi:toxin ParE1/3/4
MSEYVLTEKAVEDLSNIWNYTYERWSEQQADRYYRILLDAFSDIADNPKLGKKYPQIERSLLGFRTGRHIIFYQQQMDLKNRIKE